MCHDRLVQVPRLVRGIHRSTARAGFTLIEILIALFIFSILSLLMSGVLRSVINTQSHTEVNAEKIRMLQTAFLLLSRDMQQAVNRPITNAQGIEEAAWVGSARGCVFTHMGYANPVSTQTHSILQRTGYVWHDHALWRKTWNAVDLAPGAMPHERLLIPDVAELRFEYLDQNNHFQPDWPAHNQSAVSLPRAVRLSLTLNNGEMVTQVYAIPAGISAHATK